MQCINCGNEVKEEDNFCDKCGSPIQLTITTKSINQPKKSIKIDPIETNKYINNLIDETNPQLKKYGRISLILGIISLPLSIFLSLIIIPLPIAGIVFGIMARKKGIAGIILSFIALIIIGLIIALNMFLDKNLIGTYHCAEYMNNSVTEKQASDYDLDFTINKNLTFTMKYLNGDFIKGNINITKYEYEKENKAHEFILNLNTSYRFIDGEINLNEYTTEYSLMTYNGGTEALLYNPISMNQYICYK